MTRARDIANLVDSNGDIVAGALDNVPAADLVNDTTPQLGGALDGQLNNITNTGDISLGTNSPSTSKNIRLYGDDSRIEFHNGGAYTVGVSGGAAIRFHRPSTGHEGIDFETHNTGATHQATLKIAPEGDVTMPLQPCCFFQGNSSNNHNYGGGGVVTNFAFNNGGFFQGGIVHNSGAGRLSVPAAGRYLCGMTFYDNDGGTGAARLGIRHNGVMMGHTHTEFSNGQSAVTVFLNMSANDYIDFQQVYGTTIYMGPNHFYGFMTKIN
jgi:hypothetical protein